jgi:hypothetical protein
MLGMVACTTVAPAMKKGQDLRPDPYKNVRSSLKHSYSKKKSAKGIVPVVE